MKKGKSVSDILTIQKLVFLLSDFHYEQFCDFLSKNNANLSLKLCKAIREKLPEFNTGDELCKAVYGKLNDAHRKKFNQLTSHTFRLSEFLNRHYTYYLHHNIDRIQQLVSQAHWQQAVSLGEILLAISERVEDFKCQLVTLRFLAAFSFAHESSTQGLKYDIRIAKASEMESLIVHLQSELRKAIYTEYPKDGEKQVETFKNNFKKYHSHDVYVIRILSLFASIKITHKFDTPSFTSEHCLNLIKDLRRELHNHPHIILPYMSDIKGNLYFMMLNSAMYPAVSKERDELMEELKDYYGTLNMLKKTLSPGQLFILAAESTRLFSTYHHSVCRHDYASIISKKDREAIDELLTDFQNFLRLPEDAMASEHSIRALRMLYGSMLIISGGEHIHQGVFELESMLTAYQQINLGAATDSIFMALMVGYFSLGNYEKCEQTFKRYAKVKNKKLVYEGNDLKIHVYYYLAQYLGTGRQQYIEKLRQVLANYGSDNAPTTVMQLLAYHQIKL